MKFWTHISILHKKLYFGQKNRFWTKIEIQHFKKNSSKIKVIVKHQIFISFPIKISIKIKDSAEKL